MLKYLYCSMAFFAMELLLFFYYQPQIMEVTLQLQKHLRFSWNQRKALIITEKICKAKDHEKTIYIMGGSVGDAFLFENDPNLQKFSWVLKSYKVVNATVGRQDLLDNIRLMDHLPANSIVILPLSFYKFAQPNLHEDLLQHRYETGSQYKYLLQSGYLDTLLEQKQVVSDNAILKLAPQMNSYVSLLNQLTHNRYKSILLLRYHHFIYIPRKRELKQLSPQKITEYLERIAGYIDLNSLGENFWFLEKLYELAQQKHCHLYLIDMPISRQFHTMMRPQIAEYQKQLQSFKEKHKVKHWQITPNFHDDALFRDGYHINSQGQQFFYEQTQEFLRFVIQDQNLK